MDTTPVEIESIQQGEDPQTDAAMEEFHSKLSQEIIPKIGMEFETEESAYDFYNAYALAVGFSIRRSSAHRVNNIFVDRRFVCSCQGARGADQKDDVYRSHRPETRFGCLAMMKISCRYTSKYRVEDFISAHNHILASPRKAHLGRSHRKISTCQKLQVDMADGSGIAPRHAYEFMARQSGGREKLGFSKVDIKNYLRSKRSLEMASGDTGGVLEYLQSMKEDDPGFFYAIQVDDDDLITNIFWADGRMMIDYEHFGDVVVFDTTYRKNKDGRPIALFVGVNHHKQSTIFGAALLYDETAESFIWLFDTFSRAMGGKVPETILTDQDAAMAKALAFQWPNTYHRLCIWHIFQNAAIHLNDVFKKHKDFSRDFSKCIYEYEHEEDFLDAWSKMLDTYELQDNDWLKRMIKIKEKWALVYGRDTFCADMTTTQRSESINSLIKKYVSYTFELRRFFEHFQQLLNDRRYDEMVADFKDSQSKVVLACPAEILKHAASVYTPEVYLMLQKEFNKAYDCHIEACGEMGALMKYEVTPYRKHHRHIVSYDDSQESVCCTCRKFEFVGLLCSHILKVFSVRDVKRIPSTYILKRWTKNAKRGSIAAVPAIVSTDTDPKTIMGRRYKDLYRIFSRLGTQAVEVEDKYLLAQERLLNLLEELNLSSSKMPMQCTKKKSQVVRNPESEETLEGDLVESHDMPSSANGRAEGIRGLKLKPKPRNRFGKRLKSALSTSRKRNIKSKKVAPAENDSVCFISDHEEPSNFAQEKQTVEIDGSASQQPTGFGHVLDPYGQSGMDCTPLPIQFNEQSQPTYMELLTSVGGPQLQMLGEQQMK